MVPTMTIEFKVPNVPLFNGTSSKVIDEEFRQALNAGVLHLKGQIQPATPVGVTSHLRQGVQTSITGAATSLVGRVFDPVAYAMAVEGGSRPHFPPVAPLQLWVRRKLGIGNEKEARSVAFLIARAISRRGTPAVRMFRNAWDANRDRVVGFFEAANARIVARLVGKG